MALVGIGKTLKYRTPTGCRSLSINRVHLTHGGCSKFLRYIVGTGQTLNIFVKNPPTSCRSSSINRVQTPKLAIKANLTHCGWTKSSCAKHIRNKTTLQVPPRWSLRWVLGALQHLHRAFPETSLQRRGAAQLGGRGSAAQQLQRQGPLGASREAGRRDPSLS